MKLLLNAALVVGFLTPVLSQAQNVDRMRDRTIRQADRTVRMLYRNVDRLSPRELHRIQNQLGRIQDTIEFGLPNDPLPPRPPVREAEFEAECHIDDDTDFTPGQNEAGKLSGSSIEALVKDCDALAKGTYGNQGTSGLVRLRILSRPEFYQVAECHVDDDTDFTSGQIVVGKVAAPTVTDMIKDCQSIARASYRSSGSSGLAALNQGLSVPAGLKSAECHIDDDPDFNTGQNVVGRIWDRSIRGLQDQCAALARSTYGSNSSFGLQKVR